MSESSLSRKRAGGRRRLLTRDQVIEAAQHIGLEAFTMKRVADELGVGMATLYQYVENRDDLLRLIVARIAVQNVPPDTGQHWSEFLRSYVSTIHKAIASHPHVVIQTMEAGIPFESELRMAEDFLAFMVKRGFELAESVHIMRNAGRVAFGAAIDTCRTRAINRRGLSVRQSLHEGLKVFPAGEMLLTRQVEHLYDDESGDVAVLMIEPLIEQIARRRGEIFPDGSK